MTENNKNDLAQQDKQLPPLAQSTQNDGVLVSGLERLAIKLHNLANRLLSYIP